MAHIRNEDFYLYTGLVENGDDCFAAYDILKKSGIHFIHLNYSDPIQHPDVIASINTWFPEEAGNIKFPFVVYTAVYQFTDNPPKATKLVNGLQNIKTTNWQELFNFKGQ